MKKEYLNPQTEWMNVAWQVALCASAEGTEEGKTDPPGFAPSRQPLF